MPTDLDAATIAERAELIELGDTPIDDVLSILERDAPDYRQLYYRWERQQWEAGSIDFSRDRRQWLEEFAPEMRRSFLWALTAFYVGEELVASTLVPFADAVRTEDQQIFLTSQLADAARHTVFFDRFYSEGLDAQAHQQGRPNNGLRVLLLEMLPQISARIQNDRTDLDPLVEGFVLYHIVVEGVLALTGRRYLLNYLRENELLPGFRRGLTAVARDESRHVGFGMRFLKEMVSTDARYARVIRHTLAELVPIAMSVMEPPEGDTSYFDPLPYGPQDLRAFALDSLAKRLRVIGVDLAG